MASPALPAVSLRQLEYVVAVADHGSFRHAAEACHVAQPSLSAQVALVEEVLGVRLFERDRRGVRLTPAGEAVVVQARQVLVEVADLRTVAQQFSDPFRGTLRVGVIPTVGPYLLPFLVPALTREYPKLTFLWTEDRTAVLVGRLTDGTLDASVMALEADIGSCEYAILGRDPFVLASGPAHPLMKSRKPATPAELDEVPLLLLNEGHCFRDQVLGFCADAHAKARRTSFEATSLSTLVQMASVGTGATLLPALALPVENRRGQLRVRRFAPPAPRRTLILAWRRRSPLRPALSRIAETMRQTYPKRGAE
ncbi:MAG: LysR family transcriptional regulator [Acidobacteria bacterium RIFCSPLOWO2_02_FULL_68_18]|nr:MAG: LysR family transcriptional regulator [Acidobacteria bacterium RIFCSPLOWO2_02_FULL_68_18]OFW48744.1 MAG: LysR family transcriptional regulator [Acidobacteria bacterium RIFCSPLOWO2_12_FULL_68_19]